VVPFTKKMGVCKLEPNWLGGADAAAIEAYTTCLMQDVKANFDAVDANVKQLKTALSQDVNSLKQLETTLSQDVDNLKKDHVEMKTGIRQLESCTTLLNGVQLCRSRPTGYTLKTFEEGESILRSKDIIGRGDSDFCMKVEHILEFSQSHPRICTESPGTYPCVDRKPCDCAKACARPNAKVGRPARQGHDPPVISMSACLNDCRSDSTKGTNSFDAMRCPARVNLHGTKKFKLQQPLLDNYVCFQKSSLRNYADSIFPPPMTAFLDEVNYTIRSRQDLRGPP
jgi:hypothetical protein